MRQRLFFIVFLILPAFLSVAPVWADAIVMTRAMTASTIVELFIEDDGIRLEMEIGLSDLEGFRNLLPDEIYERMGHDPLPFAERLVKFFAEDMLIRLDDGTPLVGKIESMIPRLRIQRDEITGEPLPTTEDEGELVIYALLNYPLSSRPDTLTIAPPRDPDTGFVGATVGFMTYHGGLPVNDFRYLAQAETVDLDWDDPWYSKFRNRNLWRLYESPLSAYLYIDHFEVRKEVIIRPKDLQDWIDLGLEGRTVIAADEQAALKDRVAEFLIRSSPVLIDGRSVEPILDRIHFVRRSLRTTGVIDPPEDLDVVSATLGVIFVYPVTALPQEVTMTWEMFNDRIQRVPATATDEAGGLPSFVTPEDPMLVWRNYLTNPKIPSLVELAPPPQHAGLSIPVISAVFMIALLIVWVRWLRTAPGDRARIPIAAVLLIVMTVALWPFARVTVNNPFGSGVVVTETEAASIVSGLLKNIYRAFDYRDESTIYDTLERSATGDLLTQIYLETRRALELTNQGGARAKVNNVDMLASKTDSLPQEIGFISRCTWNVTGSVGHWGHIHQRRNRYEARFTVRPVQGAWKITAMEFLSEERTGLDASGSSGS